MREDQQLQLFNRNKTKELIDATHESPQSIAQLKGYKYKDINRIKIEQKYSNRISLNLRLGNLVSFVGNKEVPLLRIYRYKEAFAFDFVRHFIESFGLSEKDYIFDPFAGMGTTLFTSYIYGIPSLGIDKLPIATFVASTILNLLFIKNEEIRNTFELLKQKVDKSDPAPIAMDVRIMNLAFDQNSLLRLRQWKSAIDTLKQPFKDVFLLILFSTLETTSFTSKDGQFLRLKKNKKPLHPDKAILNKVEEVEYDLRRLKWFFPNWGAHKKYFPKVILGDTKEIKGVPFERSPTAIITSPPYVNRYDYTRSYCLELCFHFVKNYKELRNIRSNIIRSHIESKVYKNESPSHPVIIEVVEALKDKPLNNPKIPDMIIGYFIDMEKAIYQWSRFLAPKAQVALVVDNVRFEGEVVPVDLILSDMAEEAGFKVKEIIVARYKGNSSQQMKKYGRVPVRESIVIWRKL